MKKNIVILIAGIIFLMASNSLFAQDKANQLLSDLSKNIESHSNLVVNFTYQTTNNATQEEEEYKGKAVFKGESYYIRTNEQHTISDGTTKWTYFPDDEEVMVSDVTDDDLSPMAFLKEITTAGSAKLKESDSEGNTNIEISEIEGVSSVLFIQFDKKGEIKKIIVDSGEDGRMILTITDFQYDLKLSPNQFIFNKEAHPNVEVIDMR